MADGWHLDRRVPITLVVLIGIQTCGAIWWASAIDQSMESLEKRMTFIEGSNRRQYDIINADRAESRKTATQLARVEGLLQSIDRQVASLIAHVIKTGGAQ